ncbi:MAG: LptF/LptG family permease [Devosia sp.]|nr:LptF/LptG family permease [Devosia sp.]
MTRIDWIILTRLAGRIAVSVTVFFGLIALVESIDQWRFNYLSGIGGWPLAVLGIVISAATWLLKALPVVILVGAVIGVIDLQSRRELVAIKASGASIWRILRAPAVALLFAGFGVTLLFEDMVIATNRGIEATLPGDTSGLSSRGGLWLEQYANGERYVLQAEHVVNNARELQQVAIYLPDGLKEGRILAPSARLVDGAWFMPEATRYRAGQPPETLVNYAIPTYTTATDLRLKLTNTDDMTFYELAASVASRVSDPGLRNAVTTRFFRLLALPALLVGALFIAFAFTAGYRRSNRYGGPVIYAILAGFVVFVITEMADRAGSAGVLDPTFAACGPAFVAIVIGLTVLLYREDGWT